MSETVSSPVKLVWITPDAEKLIAEIARVSAPKNQANPKYEHLIKYLINNSHWSPFEMADACFEINTTRAIAPQILRHRSFSFQEFSQRYADPVSELDLESFPPFELRLQDKTNRQNSIRISSEEKVASLGLKELETRAEKLSTESITLYKDMVNAGIAKECARNVLPLNTPTRLYMKGSIRSWIHYVNLRSSNGTQSEHADIAKRVGKILAEHLPTIAKVVDF